jgi:hypothetical protein
MWQHAAKVRWSAPLPYQHMVIKSREQDWESWKKRERGRGNVHTLHVATFSLPLMWESTSGWDL